MPVRIALLSAAALLQACAAAPGARVEPASPPAAAAPARAAVAPPVPERDYLVFIASEATDEIALVRFGPDGGTVERRHLTGLSPADPDGPHGLAVSPDRRFYYVTTAHGTPWGWLWKYAAENDELIGRVELGAFPASLQISPDGHYAYVVNFNLHGEVVPSSVSIVSTAEMLEVARLRTCTMPHGSRLDPTGARHWSVCMMDHALIEIDARGFEVTRHFTLNQGMEHGMAGAPGARAADGGGTGAGGSPAAGGSGAGDMAGHGMDTPPPGATACSPTWAAPSADGSRVYVACNASNDIVEIDVERWELMRRIPAGNGVYNLAATADGRLLVATNKRGQSVSVFELATGRELARIPTLRPVVHGIALSDDGRYAFISVEGYGSEPGTVEMIDLDALARVASVDVGQMAGGIDFWRSEP